MSNSITGENWLFGFAEAITIFFSDNQFMSFHLLSISFLLPLDLWILVFFEVIWKSYIDHWAIPLSCRFYKVVANDTSLWFQVGFIRFPPLRLISMTNITCISGIRQSLNRGWPWLITSKIICRCIFYSSYNQLDAMLILLALNISWTQTWFEFLHMTINIFLFRHVVNLLQASFINPQAWWPLNSLVFYKTQET